MSLLYLDLFGQPIEVRQTASRQRTIDKKKKSITLSEIVDQKKFRQFGSSNTNGKILINSLTEFNATKEKRTDLQIYC